MKADLRRRLGAAIAALAAFAVLLGLVPAARANADIYWTNQSYFFDDELQPGIGRANLDGSYVNPSFITGAGQPSWGIAVDAEHVYWTSWTTPSTASLARAGLDGSQLNPSFIPTGSAGDVAVDAGHVYWANSDTIGRANLDGTGVDQSFITGANDPRSIAVDAEHVYWVNSELYAFGRVPPAGPIQPGSIGRADLDGTDVDQSLIDDAGSSPTGIAVQSRHIYWYVNNEGMVGRANLDGTDVDRSLVQVHFADDLAADAKHLYWTYFYGGTIGRANLDGTRVDQSFIAGADGPAGVAVSSDTDLAAKASAVKTQRQPGKRIAVRVKVKAGEKLTARATGQVKVNSTYKLRPRRVKLEAGEAKTLKLRPKKATAERIARALKRGDTASAKLEVMLSDQAGNRKTVKLRVRLTS